MNASRNLVIDFQKNGKHDHYIRANRNPDAHKDESVASKKYRNKHMIGGVKHE